MHHNFPASSAPAYPPLPPPPRWFSNAQPPTPLAAQAFPPPPYTGFNGNSRPPLLPNWLPPPNNQPAINYPPPNACQPQPLSSLRQYGPPSASNSYDHLNGTNNVKNSSSQIYSQVEEEKEAESNHVSQDGPEEYQGRREEKLARRKQTYYCETCNIQCSGQISYESHLEGKHHKRKLNAANGGIQGIAADPRRSGAAYKCEICNVLCSAEDVYQGHVSGQKHQRAIKNLLQTNRPIPAVALVDVFAPTVVVEQDDGQKKNNNNMAQEAKKRKSSSGPVENANLVPLGGGGSGMPTPLGLGGANAIAMVPEHINDRLVLDKVQRVQLSADQWAAIDQLASLVEETLCTVSSIIESQRAASSTAPSDSERLLRGSMRVGLLANRLLLKSDRRADLVLLCSVIPTQRILNQITEMFRLSFSQAEAAMGYAGPATIVMEVPTESAFTIYRAHTSLTIYVTLTCSKMRQWSPGDLNYYPYPEPPMALPKASCLYALAEMRRTKFYEVKSELHQSMSTTVKIVREFVNRVPAWSRMDCWMIQLLVDKVLSLHPIPLGPSAALKALFKAISDDHILEVNPTLLDPCEKLPIDVFAPLSPAERQNIFASARYALRQINIGQMAKLLALDGGSGIPQQQAEPRPKKPRFAGHASNNNSSQEEVNRIEGVNSIGSVGRMAAKAPLPPPMATGANREPVVWNPEGRTSLGNSTVPQFPNFPPNL